MHVVRPVTVTFKEGAFATVTRTRVLGAARARCRCDKQTYSSKKLAKAKAKEQSKRTGETIEAFHCFAAHGYHLGHPPKPYDFEAHRVAS